MKALILDNLVVDVLIDSETFEVTAPMYWLDCPDDCVMHEWSIIDDVLQKTPEPEDTRTYIEFRQQAYPSLEEQADMQYHDLIDGTTTWKDAIQAVKDEYPKP
jgi:hypothetical protein